MQYPDCYKREKYNALGPCHTISVTVLSFGEMYCELFSSVNSGFQSRGLS